MFTNEELTRNVPTLTKYARGHFARGYRDPEELVQTTLMMALHYRESYDSTRSALITWLTLIMRGVIGAENKVRKKRAQMIFVPLPDGEGERYPGRLQSPANQEHYVLLTELMDQLSQLPDDTAKVFYSCCVLGHTYADAANAHDVHFEHVRRAVSATRRQLKPTFA